MQYNINRKEAKLLEKNKFYWMRLYTDFFESPAILHIQSLKGSDKIIIILLKLSLMSVKYDGILRVSNTIPYTAETLARVIGISKTKLVEAIKLFKELDLMSIEDDSLVMTQVIRATGKETASAERKRRERERRLKMLLKHPPPQDDNESVNPDKKYKLNREHQGKTEIEEFVWLTQDELDRLYDTYDEDLVDLKVSELSEYIAMVGRYYESHYRTLINWINKEDE